MGRLWKLCLMAVLFFSFSPQMTNHQPPFCATIPITVQWRVETCGCPGPHSMTFYPYLSFNINVRPPPYSDLIGAPDHGQVYLLSARHCLGTTPGWTNTLPKPSAEGLVADLVVPCTVQYATTFSYRISALGITVCRHFPLEIIASHVIIRRAARVKQ